MASLSDMINHGVIKVGDAVEFTFKTNQFSAIILRGGLIGQCKLKGVHDRDYVPILEKTVAYSSLTAWTEACLQDIMDEYYTRYSSWKRVTHRESKRSMGDLRDQCKLLETKHKQDDTVELYKEILRLHNTIEEMNTYIKRLHSGEKLPYKEWSYLQINAIEKSPVGPSVVTHTIDHAAHNRIQDMICQNNGVMDYLASNHT